MRAKRSTTTMEDGVLGLAFQRILFLLLHFKWASFCCFLLICNLGVEGRSDNEISECENYRTTRDVEITDIKSLREIHIRHNLRVSTLILWRMARPNMTKCFFNVPFGCKLDRNNAHTLVFIQIVQRAANDTENWFEFNWLCIEVLSRTDSRKTNKCFVMK